MSVLLPCEREEAIGCDETEKNLPSGFAMCVALMTNLRQVSVSI